MTKLWVRRKDWTLVPDGDTSLDALSGIPNDKVLYVEIKQPRNVQHHRLFFALCSRIAEAMGVQTENISDVLKIATGHYTTIKTNSYGELKIPK